LLSSISSHALRMTNRLITSDERANCFPQAPSRRVRNLLQLRRQNARTHLSSAAQVKRTVRFAFSVRPVPNMPAAGSPSSSRCHLRPENAYSRVRAQCVQDRIVGPRVPQPLCAASAFDARVSKAPSSANGPRTPPTTSARGHDRRVIERTGRNKAIGRPTKSQPTNETIANSKKVTQAALPIANLLS
jgi:hypothetical protein